MREKTAKKLGVSVGLTISAAAMVGGIVLLAVGLQQRSHFAPEHAICQSGIGQLGQALDPSAVTSCNTVSVRFYLAWGIIVVGVLIVLWGLKLLIQSLAVAATPVGGPARQVGPASGTAPNNGGGAAPGDPTLHPQPPPPAGSETGVAG